VTVEEVVARRDAGEGKIESPLSVLTTVREVIEGVLTRVVELITASASVAVAVTTAVVVSAAASAATFAVAAVSAAFAFAVTAAAAAVGDGDTRPEAEKADVMSL
jgi:hypothetical protein